MLLLLSLCARIHTQMNVMFVSRKDDSHGGRDCDICAHFLLQDRQIHSLHTPPKTCNNQASKVNKLESSVTCAVQPPMTCQVMAQMQQGLTLSVSSVRLHYSLRAKYRLKPIGYA